MHVVKKRLAHILVHGAPFVGAVVIDVNTDCQLQIYRFN